MADAAAARSRPYRGELPAARRADQRERLLRAASRVFAKRGYAAAKIDEIVAIARVSRSSFYEFFENKEDCLRAVCIDGIERLRSELLKVVALDLEPRARVRAEVEVLARTHAADPAMARVLLIEAVGATPEIERDRVEVRLAFARIIEQQLGGYPEWRERGKDELRTVAMATMAAIAEPLIHLVATGGLDRWEEIVDPISDYVSRALILSG